MMPPEAWSTREVHGAVEGAGRRVVEAADPLHPREGGELRIRDHPGGPRPLGGRDRVDRGDAVPGAPPPRGGGPDPQPVEGVRGGTEAEVLRARRAREDRPRGRGAAVVRRDADAFRSGEDAAMFDLEREIASWR